MIEGVDMEKLDSIVMHFLEDAYPNSQHIEIHSVEAGAINLNTMTVILKVNTVGDFGNKLLRKFVRVEGKVEVTDLKISGARKYND